MHYMIYDDMSLCAEADVERLLPLVSQQRRDYAMRYRHLFGRWTTLKTYEMLMQLLQEEGYPATTDDWLYTPEGKPYIKEGPCFSISHCKNALAVVIDDRPIGIDIETIRPLRPALVERTMNMNEQNLIACDPDPARAFIRLWTRKEALLKWKGTGIVEDLQGALSEIKGCNILTRDGADYVVSVAVTDNKA